MTIKTATLNGVATIEIARPEKKNALEGIRRAQKCRPHPDRCPHTS